MSIKIKRIENPELFFGIVAPIGVDFRGVIESLGTQLGAFGYNEAVLKVTDVFENLHPKLSLETDLKNTPLDARLESYISYGDKLREHFDDDSLFAYTSIYRVMERRKHLRSNSNESTPEKIAYILHQFKRKEEIDILRAVYGRLFFQLSVYTKRSSRVDILARKIANSRNSAEHMKYRNTAEYLVIKDEDDEFSPHGQRVGKVFHEADIIINTEADVIVEKQVERVVQLIFGSNTLSPTRTEYGLYMAKSAALRSLDLSRQVGAAIFSPMAEIISLGSNEVPKAGGGTYWCDDPFDDRDFRRGLDSNYKRKLEILREIYPDGDEITLVKQFRKSQLMAALEYGRMIHAEMSAITDAARLGRPLKGAILFTTTFPCHMCAKHIVAAGIDKVIFLEPYPKSLASELHSDSIFIEGQSRENYDKFPSCYFEHFYGISPKRYRDFFERGARKNEDGTLIKSTNQPIIDITVPVYLWIESMMLKDVLKPLLNSKDIALNEISEDE